MITTIRKRLEQREEGFTLIELLVVVIIIGILAAIAVPTFLNQRAKAGDSAAKADLRNAAIAQESYFTDGTTTGGAYATAAQIVTPAAGSFKKSTSTVFHVAVGSPATSYCMAAQGSNSDKVWRLTNVLGSPEEVPAGTTVAAACSGSTAL